MKVLITFIFMMCASMTSMADTPLQLFQITNRNPPDCGGHYPCNISCLQVACRFTDHCDSDADIVDFVKACEDVNGYCVNHICNQRGCSFKQQTLDVINACKNVSPGCIEKACFYGHCDMDSDIQEVTQACRGVTDSDCITTLCNQKGDCSMRSRFVKYVNLCAGKY